MTTRDRGAIGVGVVAVLVFVEVVVVVAVIGGSLQQDLTLQRIDTNRAFYAAEGGLAMAVREVWLANDEDGDGVIGGVSSDADAGNDPQIGGALVSVSSITTDDVYNLTAVGRTELARRRVEFGVKTNGPG